LNHFCARKTFVWRSAIAHALTKAEHERAMTSAWAPIRVEPRQAANDRWLAFPRRREISTVTRGAAGACTRIVLNAKRPRA
jgi:hypothetical protein